MSKGRIAQSLRHFRDGTIEFLVQTTVLHAVSSRATAEGLSANP
jgi:hypothetical protein